MNVLLLFRPGEARAGRDGPQNDRSPSQFLRGGRNPPNRPPDLLTKWKDKWRVQGDLKGKYKYHVTDNPLLPWRSRSVPRKAEGARGKLEGFREGTREAGQAGSGLVRMVSAGSGARALSLFAWPLTLK